MHTVLKPEFFARGAVEVAHDLIGMQLVRKTADGSMCGMITETEAYDGPHDLACHAARGRTARTKVLFGPPGIWYVYFIYGMYDMLNVVTGPKEYPAAVLIRAVEDVSGPGRLTRTYSITRELNTKPARRASGLWIEDRGVAVPENRIMTTPRIGVAYAKEWADKPWRFVLKP